MKITPEHIERLDETLAAIDELLDMVKESSYAELRDQTKCLGEIREAVARTLDKFSDRLSHQDKGLPTA